MLSNLGRLLRPRRRGDEFEHDVREELLSHIEMRTEDNVAAGMTPDEAREAALQRFGDLTRIRQACCEIDRAPRVDARAIKPFFWAAVGSALAFWTMGGEYHNLRGVSLLLASVAVMLHALVMVRRMGRTRVFACAPARRDPDGASFPVLGIGAGLSAHDSAGATPLERALKDE